MAQSVLELAVQTGKWDAGLKKAQQALNNFTQSQGGLQQALQKDGDKVKQFVEVMGKTTSQAKTARGQMNEYKSTIEQLSRSYNSLSESEKKTFGQTFQRSIDQVTQKFKAAQEEAKRLNATMNSTPAPGGGGGGGLGGLLGGGKLDGMVQVMGGNLMAKGVMMATQAVSSFVGEIQDAIKQGIELAKEGEGVRLAFERLGRGDILEGLREATHGTVTDIELMKAAVKFNDFKLPIEELGTMLAFAQQKTKDTSQSVDYMVDSIVTGLGRQSLQILDNLGISANDVKEKMKQTGDMTKAVGEIIREQMAKSGDYIETAADRATQADVRLKNAMEDLGRTFQPLDDAANSMWTSIKVGALNLLNDAVRPLIDALTEAGRLRRELGNINAMAGGGQTHSAKTLGMLKHYSGDKQDLYNRQVSRYEELEAEAWRKANKYRVAYKRELEAGGNSLALNDYKKQLDLAEAQAKAWAKVRKEYQEGAKEIFSPTKTPAVTPVGGGGKTPKGGGRTGRVTTPKADDILPVGSVAALNKKLQELRKEQELATDTAGWEDQQSKIDELTYKIKVLKGEMPDPNKIQPLKRQGGASVIGIGVGQDELDEVQRQLKAMLPDGGIKIPVKLDLKTDTNLAKDGKAISETWRQAASAVQSVGSALQNIEDPSARIAGMIGSAIANIALGFAEAASKEAKGGVWYWIAATAAGLATMISTISAIHSSTGYAEGGIVKGNQYSGDNIPGGAMLNAGELVLNRAQQGNLASQLQEGGGGYSPSHISGEQIYIALNRYTQRSGKGEIVTWK